MSKMQVDEIVCDENKNGKTKESIEDAKGNHRAPTARQQRSKTESQSKVSERGKSSKQQRSSASNNSVIAQSKLDRLLNKPKTSHVPAHVKAPFKTAPETKRIPRSRLVSGFTSRQPSARSASSGASRSASSCIARSSAAKMAGSTKNSATSSGSTKLAFDNTWSSRSSSASGLDRRQLPSKHLVSICCTCWTLIVYLSNSFINQVINMIDKCTFISVICRNKERCM